jgi:hypothetical protein
VLAVVSLGLVALPLMAVLALVASRIARGVAPVFDAVGPVAPVWRMERPHTPVAAMAREREWENPSLPVGFRYDAVMPGPLQLVDDAEPSTKICPDCAETVLGSARVCKHCRYRFEPPLSGSWATA